MSHTTRNTGFSLIELLVATIVLSLLIVSISGLYFYVDQSQRRSQAIAAATRAGEQQIESLRNQHYNTLEPGESIDFTDELPDRIPEPRSAIVEVSEPEPDLRRLDVTVRYGGDESEQRVRLSALIGSIGISQ